MMGAMHSHRLHFTWSAAAAPKPGADRSCGSAEAYRSTVSAAAGSLGPESTRAPRVLVGALAGQRVARGRGVERRRTVNWASGGFGEGAESGTRGRVRSLGHVRCALIYSPRWNGCASLIPLI